MTIFKQVSLGEWVVISFAALFVLGMACGCSAAGVGRPAGELRATAAPDWTTDAVELPAEKQAAEKPAPLAPAPGDELFPLEPYQSLRVTPDPELIPAVQEAAADYWQTFGVRIEIVEDGIPILLLPEILYTYTAKDGTKQTSQVDGLAHYDAFCVAYACNDPRKGVNIQIAESLIGDKAWAMKESMRHELGHILSGWGSPSRMGMHLPSQVGVMSPGCVNHVCMPWSDADAEMICAGVECQWMRYPSASELPHSEGA